VLREREGREMGKIKQTNKQTKPLPSKKDDLAIYG
jgi:hypothetical protein